MPKQPEFTDADFARLRAQAIINVSRDQELNKQSTESIAPEAVTDAILALDKLNFSAVGLVLKRRTYEPAEGRDMYMSFSSQDLDQMVVLEKLAAMRLFTIRKQPNYISLYFNHGMILKLIAHEPSVERLKKRARYDGVVLYFESEDEELLKAGDSDLK